ncbi:MAG: 2-oxoacid:acceptor oxidoreductase family protein, partial [Clostridia bacterium]|nr:2-oxoacid:acceptor oxidoreductase family protein [Clostridia bacterium]
QINPMPVITGAADYPENILDKLCEASCDDFDFEHVIFIDALRLAQKAGNAKAVNVVLIGELAKNTEISYEEWVDAIKATVPPKFLEVNLKAFDLGYNL